MKPRKFLRPEALITPATLTLLAAGATPLRAQVKLPPLQFEESRKQGYFLRLGPRIEFDVNASVSASPQTVQQPGHYDDGFVLPDASGPASGLTWNWGYQNAGQVSGDTLNFQRYSNLPHAGVFKSGSDDPMIGGEVVFGVEFGTFNLGAREFTWGAEIGYDYSPFKVSNSSVASGTVDYLAASYSLGGIVPPAAPYQGTPAGPGPVIGVDPASTTAVSSPATSTFQGTLKSDLHVMKLGLWLEAPIARKVTASLSLGYASVFADTHFDFREVTTIADSGIPALATRDASVSASNWQGGFYGQLRATWQFGTFVGAYVAGDFQYNNKFHFSGAGREVMLDFKNTYAASVGLVFSW